MIADTILELQNLPLLAALRLASFVLFSGAIGLALFYFVRHRVKQIPLWKIPGPESVSFITGNNSQMFHAGAGKFHEYLIRTYGRVIRITMFLWDTQLVISDPSACTSILLKDQDVFEETEWFLETNRHAFGPGLLATMGAHHRKQRKQLNPVFSIKHMRAMVPLFHNLTQQLQEVLKRQVEGGARELDLLEYLGRLALELIAQGGLGYTFDSLNYDHEENEFSKAIKQYSISLSSIFFFRMQFPLVSNWPSWLLRFGAKLFPLPMLHNVIRVTDIMYKHTKQVYDNKKALLEKGGDGFAQQAGDGKDIITVLMRDNADAPEEERLPEEEILGHMSTFLFAGTDTTSTALSRIFYLLSEHQDVQERLRQELAAAWEGAGESGIGYDKLVELPYLEAVCRETLRLYPPIHFISRLCRADISIPLSQPIETKGGSQSSLFVPRGTSVIVNILGINRDQNIWGPDVLEWKPERWLAPLPESVTDARIPGVYANTLTFLGGGRACIGFKFSQLEMKVILSQLLPTFRFSPSKAGVVWNFGTLTTPGRKGSTGVTPQLPMVVERI
ncbi:cytochrome P450 [Artomyces pyxidatus]|uniref:Cytochrome P450 n=1 Tax=Artomyces pyxidatus TaxID=48021 RepID=A0ACB8SF31_9AGAM|nr:cytochrome P450 [Artomyces pyxidatus]